jgi:hypothetical protein
MNESIPPPTEEFKTVPDLAGTTELRSEDAQGQSSGEKEAAAVASGSLEEETRRAEHGRSERFNPFTEHIMSVWLFLFLSSEAIAMPTKRHFSESVRWLLILPTTITAFFQWRAYRRGESGNSSDG